MPARSRSVARLSSARWATLPALALLAAALLAPSGGHGQQLLDRRVRPWPDAWPIVLPPTAGPLPRHPPVAPPTEPATRAAARVVDVVAQIRRELRDTRYQHHRVVQRRSGIFRWDCSLMAEWVLREAAPRTLAGLGPTTRPLASHFVRAIERAPTSGRRHGWQRLAHIEEVRPGDVFAWRRPDGFPSRNSGHVGFVLSTPAPVPQIPGGYAVQVADATSSQHQDDTRPYPGEGGFGIGTLVFLTDGSGNGTHYGWGGTLSGGYVVTPILFGRVGP